MIHPQHTLHHSTLSLSHYFETYIFSWCVFMEREEIESGQFVALAVLKGLAVFRFSWHVRFAATNCSRDVTRTRRESRRKEDCVLQWIECDHARCRGEWRSGQCRIKPSSHLQNPSLCHIYTEHTQPTTVAKYAPSGFYIASGDNSGKVRVWDTTQSTHILKVSCIYWVVCDILLIMYSHSFSPNSL